MPQETRPYYVAYAGMYGTIIDGDDYEPVWSEEEYSYWHWKWVGHDLTEAIRLMNVYQQEGWDFCGIQAAFAS